MSATHPYHGAATARRYRTRHTIAHGIKMLLGLVIALWSIIPVYNMCVIALDSHDDIFAGDLWPPAATLHSFHVMVTEGF